MLTRQRFESSADGDLYIHTRNLVAELATLFCGLAACAVPLMFLVDGFFGGRWLPARLAPLEILLVLLGLILLGVLGVAVLLLLDVRETLFLSHRLARGERRKRNLFGGRERVHAMFALRSATALEMRVYRTDARRVVQAWLLMADGTEQRLTPELMVLRPGQPRTDRWLQVLAGYLALPTPDRVIELPVIGALPAPPAVAAHRHVPTQTPEPATRRPAPSNRPSHADPAPPPMAADGNRLGWFARALTGLLGAFLSLVALAHAVELLGALSMGRLRVASSVHGSGHTYLWSEAPVGYLMHAGAGILGVMVVGLLGIACLYVAVAGRTRRPR
ncbi:MAG: hypothetical protein RR704_11670 [Stenotrophomonas sp.]|uniref:hypothetical protein n=1 Tax=Stenotrophomonas sp. TaxID=69392 RepID=UPI002FCC1BB8